MENEDLKPNKEERLRLEWSWKKTDGTVEYFHTGERRAAKENLVLRFEFMDASVAAREMKNPETWKLKYLKNRFKDNLNLQIPKDSKGNANSDKTAKKKVEVTGAGEPEKEVKIKMAFKQATELAATAMVATVMVNPSEVISTPSIDQLEFSDLYVNIKRESYLGTRAKIVPESIDIKGEAYTVKNGKRNQFIEAIQNEYTLAGHTQMHPFVTAAIEKVIEKPISVNDGIPGLHAEVLAVNNELFLYSARLALVVYKAAIENTPEGPKPRQLTQVEFTQLETEFNNQLQRQMLVYTHKFGKHQMDSMNNGQAEKTTTRFAACKNCTNILKQFCNVKIQTGVTQQ